MGGKKTEKMRGLEMEDQKADVGVNLGEGMSM